MLDEVYPDLDQAEGDENIYTLGRIKEHNIVIACLPAGTTGIIPASKQAADMLRTFPRIRFGLMVGIGGGAPCANKPPSEDIRLGDVVVSTPDKTLGGVVKYNHGKVVAGGKFERTGMLNMPPTQLRNGVSKLRSKHEQYRNAISRYVSQMIEMASESDDANPQFRYMFCHQGLENDQLFEASYEHVEFAQQTNAIKHTLFPAMGLLGCVIIIIASTTIVQQLPWTSTLATCSVVCGIAAIALIMDFRTGWQSALSTINDPKRPCPCCNKSRIVHRQPRETNDPIIHYGTIASDDVVMRHATTRDKLQQQYNILCFETEAAGLMNDFPCLVIRGISDYSDTHKHKLWQRYAAATAAAYTKELLEVIPPTEVTKMGPAVDIVDIVRNEFATIHAKMNKSLGPLLNEQVNKEHKKILDWLAPSSHESQHLDAYKKHQPGTVKWFLESQEFLSLMNGDVSTLFCPGIPGAGKTILASMVIKHLQEQGDGQSCITFLYCSYGKRQEQTTENLLSTLLRHVVEQCDLIPESVSLLYESHTKKHIKPTPDSLLDTLIHIIRTQNRAFLVVDAVDECPDETWKGLLKAIRKLQDNTRLGFMATSRPSLEREIQGATRLEIRASQNDIESYLDNRFQELSKCAQQDSRLKENIKQQICDAADGMFLLATLHMDSLKDKRTPNEFRIALQSLPKGLGALDMAYDNAVSRIDDQGANSRTWARRVLSWVFHAIHPLRPIELQHALAIAAGDRRLQEDRLPVFEEITSLCAGLVILNQESRTIQLVHYTTQEYFSNLDWIQTSIDDITTSCITYLHFDDFESGFCPSKEEFEKRIELHPFYAYAASTWGHHARSLPIKKEDLIMGFLESKAKVSACSQVLLNYKFWSVDNEVVPGQASGVHLAAYFGLQKALVALFNRGHGKDSRDSHGQTPLYWAVEGGNVEGVALLLSKGANPNLYSDGVRWTPLLRAIGSENESIIRLLLESHADPNFCSKGYTPLILAISLDYEKIVKVLLEYADPNLYSHGYTPLTFAIFLQHEGVVNILLECADPNLCSNDRTPLLHAISTRHEGIIQILLKCADPNLCSNSRTPLAYAICLEHEEAVRLLLESHADPDFRGDHNEIPLLLALLLKHEGIIKLLLKHIGPNLCSSGPAPLPFAVVQGYEEGVKLLLELYADLNFCIVNVERDMETAISVAKELGHEEILELLLDSRSKVVSLEY
ncbi:hypothetical protein ABOM_001263 [Aspergillus bombycis]|uniref:Uncharacterized protein n=1 Tax=Aspergillus bombycis TaxID=109264 RepID=A0A1F8AEC0_9EURO|nr:hypothetical protein ABOM_001263 [Aspergillus bombycis]OGM50007.1 hypothetical protein ABOM_001263 [Aspergillus bombycis]